MVKFERFQLSNGLKVIFHKDTSTPMAVVNVLYDIGARDESEEKTGFAHLFEHLMFGGSVNILILIQNYKKLVAKTMPLQVTILQTIMMFCQQII